MGEGVRSKSSDMGKAIDEGTRRGGIKTAAKGAAESFGRGVLDGIEQGYVTPVGRPHSRAGEAWEKTCGNGDDAVLFLRHSSD
jgi:hypothetical protein